MSLATYLLPKTNPLWRPLPLPGWSENLLALQAMISAAPSPPHVNGVMASPPTAAAQAGATLPSGVGLTASLATHRGVLEIVTGWHQPYVQNYVQSPSGVLSVAGLDSTKPTRGFYKRVVNRVPCRVRNTNVVACKFYGFSDSDPTDDVAFEPVKLRLIVDGEYASLDGDVQADGAGAQWIKWTFGSTIADANILVEGGASVAIDAVGIATGGEILRHPAPVYERALVIAGDSIVAGGNTSVNFNGFGMKLADKLGFYRRFLNGNPGTGLIYKSSNPALLNLEERIDDFTDYSRVAREGLPLTPTIEAGQRTYPGMFVQAGTINDIGKGYTQTQIYDAQSRLLDGFEAVCPWVPLLIAGPWDRNAPLASESGYGTIRDGQAQACEGRAKARFLDVTAEEYGPKADATHPLDDGHTVCSDDILYPLIVDAIDDMASAL